MEWWQKGAINGAIWSIVGTPVYILLALFLGEHPPEIFVWIFGTLVYLPNTILNKFFFEQIEEFTSRGRYHVFFVFITNFLGWVMMGATSGHFYGRWKEKQNPTPI